MCALATKAGAADFLMADSVAAPGDTAQAAKLSCHLSGRVVDEDQKPLPFVMVKVEGQMAGGTTNLDGRYSFDFLGCG